MRLPYFTAVGWVMIMFFALLIGTIAGITLHWEIVRPFMGG